jgi:translation initiation factor 2-alpha kinase 4
MNYRFSTGSERIAVIEDLRKPEVPFPSGWDPALARQRQSEQACVSSFPNFQLYVVITWLLQHDTAKRPTALELSQSSLLPPRLEDEYFKGALQLMCEHCILPSNILRCLPIIQAKPDSPHHQVVLASLFNRPLRPVRGFLYDMESELPEHAHLNGPVQERLTAIFRLHGAVDTEPPLLIPVMSSENEENQAIFIDRHGEVVALPDDMFVPFARLAARENLKRIKRYHITNIFRPKYVSYPVHRSLRFDSSSMVAGHPKVNKAAVIDIISPDLATGQLAAGAEILTIISECLDCFPSLAQSYDIRVSHSKSMI